MNTVSVDSHNATDPVTKINILLAHSTNAKINQLCSSTCPALGSTEMCFGYYGI
jgi:hypothetical protein